MQRQNYSFFSVPLLLIGFSLLLTLGCQRDVDGGTPNGTGDDSEQVTAGIRGIVVDENDQPVEGAQVTSGTQVTTTDRFGVFRFDNIRISRRNAHVRVTRTGYFPGDRNFISVSRRTHNIRIRLLRRAQAGSFAATTGGTINLTNGAKLVLPAAAISDANGNAYSGTVNVSMVWIDPTRRDLSEVIPGDLRGITTTGEERGLETYGMLGVELNGPGGEVLKVASGKTAELTFPIPASIVGTAPNTIDLWYFDETSGRWKQEGTATKTGSNYIAQVSHFTFWNCDAPFPLIELCMNLVNASNNQPLNNVHVRIRRTSGETSGGYTDSIGNICGPVPKNETLTLEILDQCHNVIFSQSIGPFNANTSLGTFSVNASTSNMVTISGTLVNCTNTNVTNGAVVIYTDYTHSYSVPVTNGAFTATILRCASTPMNYAVQGIDLATLQESPMVTGTATTNTVNVGTLQACSAGLSEYIEYIINGVPSTWVDLGGSNFLNSFDSTATGGPYPNKTTIQGQHINNNNAETTYFWYNHNMTTGTFPLDGTLWNIKINSPAGNMAPLVRLLDASPFVNITVLGPAGTGYIEGNFNVTASGPSGSPSFPVTCHFKIRR